MQITVVHHPLLQVKMSVLRDINTDCPTFRRVIGEVAMLLTFEAAKNIPLETHSVTTPLAETVGHSIKSGAMTAYRFCRRNGNTLFRLTRKSNSRP